MHLVIGKAKAEGYWWSDDLCSAHSRERRTNFVTVCNFTSAAKLTQIFGFLSTAIFLISNIRLMLIVNL